MESHKDRLLRLWKARQEAEGHDVSGVNTLEEANHFFDKKKPVVPAAPKNTSAQKPKAPKNTAAKKSTPKKAKEG